MNMYIRASLAIALASGVAASPASAAHILKYSSDLSSINGVGAGFASFTLDRDARTLQVDINATGLDEGTHLAHLHGRFSNGVSGTPVNSILPDPSDDADGDGFVELGEALPDYGAIILNMDAIGTGSSINYSNMFDLTDPSVYGFVGGDMNNPKYSIDDLIGADEMSLDLRELIIHGQSVPSVGAGTPGEVDGTAGFKVLLPTLGGEVSAVPEPATWLMMMLGFGVLGSVMRRKRNVRVTYA